MPAKHSPDWQRLPPSAVTGWVKADEEGLRWLSDEVFRRARMDSAMNYGLFFDRPRGRACVTAVLPYGSRTKE